MREYLIGVTATALICAIVKTLLPEKGTLGTAVKLISGVFMLVVVIRPLMGMSGDSVVSWSDDISTDGASIVAEAEAASKETMRLRIKEETEAYILSKAEALGAQIQVSVTLSDEAWAVPAGVRLAGAVSPYAKQALSRAITNDLGIDKEAQEWIG